MVTRAAAGLFVPSHSTPTSLHSGGGVACVPSSSRVDFSRNGTTFTHKEVGRVYGLVISPGNGASYFIIGFLLFLPQSFFYPIRFGGWSEEARGVNEFFQGSPWFRAKVTGRGGLFCWEIFLFFYLTFLENSDKFYVYLTCVENELWHS